MPAKINFSADDISQMRSSYESGQSFGDIASTRGCATNTVRSALLSTGVLPNAGRSISAKMVGRPSPRKGISVSADTRARMSAARKGGKGTRFGPHSAETLAKISAATKGKNVRYTDEQRHAIESLRQVSKRFVRRVLRATGRRKTTPSAQALGYSSIELLAHLGPRPTGAHVDHYVPIAEFIRRGIICIRTINALPNLRWLPGAENQRKSDKVPMDADEVIERCISFSPRPRSEVLTAHFTPQGVSYTRGLA